MVKIHSNPAQTSLVVQTEHYNQVQERDQSRTHCPSGQSSTPDVPMRPLTVLAVTAATPPVALLANVGNTCPLGTSGLASDLAAAIRFARGTHGAYVVFTIGAGIPTTPAGVAGC
jgi:hypothetical protein